MKSIFVITGQTATGKTAYALELAKQMNGELINADSRQIYKKMNIVTGKDLHQTDGNFIKINNINNGDIGYFEVPFSNTKLWLYDIIDPKYNFSAHDYKKCALNAIEHILQHNKIPIIVGGSYLYIKNLLFDTIDIHVPPNEKLRIELSGLPVKKLQTKLSNINPTILDTMNKSDLNNPHRLIRKIEIETTQKSSIKKPSSPLSDEYKVEIIGFRHKNIQDLGKIIEKRVIERIQAGAIEETQGLLQYGYTLESPGLNAIGYRQIISFLEGAITMQNMIQEWTTKEIQYAKRQHTFMKQNKDIAWTEL